MDSAAEQLTLVLLIHDSPRVRDEVARDLKHGYRVTATESADSALQSLDAGPPDVILCEARLLCARDFDLLKRLRAHPCCANSPLILLSGPDADDARRASLKAGADDFLREPFGALELQARVNAHVRALRVRQQIEAKLREREERLRASLTASRAGAYRWDYRTGKVEWDESLDRLMGFPPGKTMTTHEQFRTMLHPDDRARVDHACNVCLATGANFDTEYRLAREDGAYLWMHDRAKTVRDAQGKPRYLAGACMDVTERKQSELRRHFFASLDEALRPLIDPSEITATAARHLGEHLEVDRCAYAEVHADQDTFDIVGQYNRNAPPMTGRYSFSQFGREVLQCMRANKSFVVHDIDSHQPPLEESTIALARHTHIYAAICVPLHKNSRLVSAMAVHQTTPRNWTADELELAQTVVNRCWESIERARVTRSLQESERRFRQLANFVPMMIWEAQPDGTVDYYNERWYEFTGFEREATGDSSWSPMVHPEDRQRVHDLWYQAVHSGKSYHIECRVKDRRTGDYRWIMGRAVPVRDAAGNVIRWFGSNTDIHEAKLIEQALRESEERFRAMFEATPECVSVISREGALLQINSSGLEVIQAESEDEVRGKSVLELIAPEHRQKWMENHERVCMGENRRWEFEIVGLRGRRRWMESHAVPVTVTEGEQAHLAITRDVTDRKRHEAERERLLAAERSARAEAEQNSRLKDEFLSTLSHELRTPLNAVLGYATLIRMAEMSGEELDEATAIIERNAKLQARLIDDLLDMNRIISGKVRLNIQTVSVAEILEAALDAARPMAEAKSIRLDTVVDPMARPVRGDPDRLQQVFWNLLSNAIKFTPSGGSVKVALEPAGSRIELSVMDTGEGISPEFLPHVFDQFRQDDASTTRKHGGLGLGLSIVKHLIEVHGGAVQAQSEGKNKGATFTVSLPVAAILDPEDVQRRVQAAATPEPASGPVSLSGVEVLAVDDEPDACVLVKRVLEGCHAKVETAGSVREALELIRAREFDVLVSDIGMPIEDGYDLMRTVRSMQGAGAQMRAVALTAFARPEDRQRAALAGFHMHVSKPVEAGELIAIVANLTGRHPDRVIPSENHPERSEGSGGFKSVAGRG